MKFQIQRFYKLLLKNKFSFSALFFCVFLFAYQSDNWFSWKNKGENQHLNILTDGSGYYAYLPATFIYKDYRFQFLNHISQKYQTTNFVNGTNIYAEKNQLVDKYFIGSAICMSPFFITTHLGNKLLSKECDGYSKSYRLALSLSTLFYYFMGMLAIILLLNLFQVKDWISAFVILGISLGTSIHFYTVYYPAFSHIYSFFAISWFVYLCKKYTLTKSKKTVLFLFVLLALIFLIRPTNVVIIFLVPFLFESWSDFKTTITNLFKEHKKTLLLGFSLFFVLCSLQFINVYFQTGSFQVDTYGDEKFTYLFEPKIFEVLFSYKKGLFVYAPVLFLFLVGLPVLFFKNRFLFYGVLLTFLFVLYITSAWWCWWYGGGLGMRPFVDFSVLFVLPIVFLLKYSKWMFKILILACLLFSIQIYRVYQMQFNNDILHYELMTKDTFWTIFLKPDQRNAWLVFFQDDKINSKKYNKSVSIFYNSKSRRWENDEVKNELDFGFKGKDLDISYIYIPTKKSKDKIVLNIAAIYKIFNPATNPGYQFHYYSKGKEIAYKDFHIGSKIPNLYEEKEVEFTILSNLPTNEFDSLKIDFTRNYRPTAIKNLKIKFLTPSTNR